MAVANIPGLFIFTINFARTSIRARRAGARLAEMGPKRVVETMTEYEMEREARLAKNREVLRRLGVPEMAAATGMATAGHDDDDDERERRKKMRKAARARDSGGGEPARRSSRASTVATRTGRFYEGKGDGADDDDDSFSEEEDDDADGSDDEDEDDLDDERRPTAKPEAKKKKKKIPAEPRPERRATPASLYRLPNQSMLGRLAPYAVEGAGFERRPSAFMRPRLSSIPSSGATGDGGIEPTVARPIIDAVASTDYPPSTAERPKAARKAPRVQKRQRAKKPPAKPPPTPEGFADDVAAAFAAIQPAANRVAMNRGFATIDTVTIGHRELVDACRRHGFYEWSEGDVAKMMAVAGEAVGRDGASCGETRLSLEDFKRVATHVGARRADV